MKIFGNLFTTKRSIGDRVVHGQTRFYGVIEGIETVGGIDLLTVKLDRGGVMSKIDRREFMTVGKREGL